MMLPKIKSTKKERKQYTNEGILESLGGIVTEAAHQAKENLDDGSHDAWNQLLKAGAGEKHGEEKGAHGGELSPGHELDLSGVAEQVHEITEQGREFAAEIIHVGKRAQNEQSQEIQVKMQEILIEIKKLTESSQELKEQVEVISIEQTAENPGVYHVNFLEKMLSFIHDLRVDVEDGLAWFGALRSKKAARQYGVLAKKHGTSFTLSNERQVATQVG